MLQPNYQNLIDEQTWMFIRKTQKFYPDNAVELSVAEQRVLYNELCHSFKQSYPESVRSRDGVIIEKHQSIPVRRYCVEDTVSTVRILYFHGGGYIVGGLDSHDDVCAELCARTGFDLTSVDYRLSPEHKHPAAFEDCLHSVVYEAQNNSQAVLLCGDSAGGNLAAAVAHKLRGHDAISILGQVLIYPQLGGDTSTGSYIEHASAPMLNADEVAYYLKVRLNNDVLSNSDALASVLTDASFTPLHDNNFANLPQTMVYSAQCDPLSDDGKHYCSALNAAGGSALWVNEKGMVHGYLRARHSSVRASQSFTGIVNALSSMASGQFNLR